MRFKAENKKGKLVLYTLYKVLLIVRYLLSFIFPMNDSCLGGFVSPFFSRESSLESSKSSHRLGPPFTSVFLLRVLVIVTWLQTTLCNPFHLYYI